jgi:putative spermidine/putrescine transport system permease protein
MRSMHRPLLWGWTALVLLFLVAPIVAIMPIAFSAGTFLSYPLPGFSLRWFAVVFETYPWLFSLRNSVIVGLFTVVFAVPLGTLAAFGLHSHSFPGRDVIRAMLLSPMVMPVVIVGLAATFALSRVGLQGTFVGMIAAHTALALPFVIIPVSATLKGLDPNFARASASLGASPLATFRQVTLPLIMSGVASGAVFAFITSFDEVVVALFVSSPSTLTLPRQLFSGLRDQLNPSLVAIAFVLIVVSCLMMVFIELLRLRNDKLLKQRGSPS